MNPLLSETLGKDRSDNLRECSFVHVVLAVARNRFCGPVNVNFTAVLNLRLRERNLLALA